MPHFRPRVVLPNAVSVNEAAMKLSNQSRDGFGIFFVMGLRNRKGWKTRMERGSVAGTSLNICVLRIGGLDGIAYWQVALGPAKVISSLILFLAIAEITRNYNLS